MTSDIPSTEALRACLLRLTHKQMQQLAADTDVPFTTLWKVRSGETLNPGIETVRKFAALAAEMAAAEPAPPPSGPLGVPLTP